MLTLAFSYPLGHTREDDALNLDVEVCILADQYAIASLKDLATKKATTYVGYWGEVFFSTNLESIVTFARRVYAGEHAATAIIRQGLVKKLVVLGLPTNKHRLAKFHDVMRVFPEFAVDLIAATACNSGGCTSIAGQRDHSERFFLKCTICMTNGVVTSRQLEADGGMVRCSHCGLNQPQTEYVIIE